MTSRTHAAVAPHIFTVDVEDYFQASIFRRSVRLDDWDARESRLDRNVSALLELLANARATATFFALGWTATRQPAVLRAIARAGHEIASRGMFGTPANELSPARFREDVAASKAAIEDCTGQLVRGFRAPEFSIGARMEWAYDALLQEGYEYDSSQSPVREEHRGTLRTPDRFAHTVQSWAGTLIEVPISVIEAGGARFPAGGASLRHLPYAALRNALHSQQRCATYAVVHVRPWELDPDQPRLRAPFLARARHYAGLSKTAERVARLLQEFRFSAVESQLPELRNAAFSTLAA